MGTSEMRERFETDGFVILPGYLAADDLGPALAELALEFPTADEFHDDVDLDRNARFRDEFAGITNFPFTSVQLSLVSVHHRLVELAAALLGSDDLRVYSIEAWAKYTGAADYDQAHHRDYLNHSLLVPAPGQAPTQIEVFLYLSDVPTELGPPSYVPLRVTGGLPALPNWCPPGDGAEDPDHPTWVSRRGRPELYEAEVSAAGQAGTVVAYRIETFHRGTALTRPRGSRYTVHVNFRIAACDWIGRRGWAESANGPEWEGFVAKASVPQLRLFGFPPPGHPYWTEETLEGMRRRYPALDTSRWRG
jgi:hypothetical protein